MNCLSPNVIRVVKSRRMIYEQFEAHMEEKKICLWSFSGQPGGKEND